MVEAVVPYRGALSFFLGLWQCIPETIQLFVSFVFIALFVVVVIRAVIGH